MDIDEQLKEIKTEFRLAMNGPVSQSMREQGFRYHLNFGVELPRIKNIAENYKPDYHLAVALWNEDIRECKILAAMLMPVEEFTSDIADIWVEQIDNIEMAELTSMNLFRKLSYAPALSFKWISDEREYVQTCGFLVIAHLLQEKPDMYERAENEFIDQAVCCALSDKYNVRKAAWVAIRTFMSTEAHVFSICRAVEGFADSTDENKQTLYNLVRMKVTPDFE